MRELIYYPGFEVEDFDWLKFALLYLNKLDPIIPHSGDALLSEKWLKLSDETDLIDVHRPEPEEGYIATMDALDHVEKILTHPDRYEPVFNTRNIVDEWKRPEKQTWTLFQEKYVDVWEDFCLDNQLARQSDYGLLLPKELCLLYMTVLAQCIADSKGVSAITDYRRLNNFSIFTRRVDPADSDAISIVQSVIQLEMPGNLSYISIDDVIRHRNRQGFKEKQSAFHNELNAFVEELEKGEADEDLPSSLGSTWSDFRADLLSIGVGVLTFGLGVWLLLQSSGVGVPAVLERIAGGASVTVGSLYTIKKTWHHTKNKRLARKYLAELRSLG